MTAQKSIQWRRVLVEASAIVLSILLAFSIEAWWAESQERGVEQQALASLRSDFGESRETLSIVLQIYEQSQAEFVRFQSSTPSELSSLDSDAIGAMVTAFTVAATFDPWASTLDALVRDGRLGLISDLALRESLSTWLRALEDIGENGLDIRSGATRVLRAMEAHGGPFQNPGPTPGATRRRAVDLHMLPTADGSTLSALRQDSSFVGMTRSHQFAVALYLRELNEIASILDSTLALIEKSIR